MEEIKPVSKVPEITPELLAENEELQAELRKKFTYVAPLQKTYADTVIKGLLADIEYYQQELINRNDIETWELLNMRLKTARRDCAQWLISIGNFELAEKMALDEHTKRLCRAKLGIE